MREPSGYYLLSSVYVLGCGNVSNVRENEKHYIASLQADFADSEFVVRDNVCIYIEFSVFNDGLNRKAREKHNLFSSSM